MKQREAILTAPPGPIDPDASVAGGSEGDRHQGGTVEWLGRIARPRTRIPDAVIDSKEKEIISEIMPLLSEQKLEDVQYELARLSCLVPLLRVCDQPDRLEHVRLAVKALAGEKPNSDFAKAVRSELEFDVLRTQRGIFRFVYRISGTTSLSAVLSGLLMSAIMMIVLAVVLGVLVQPQMNGQSGLWSDRLIFHMGLLAAGGGFISVLSRLSQFAAVRAYDPFLFFTTGFFKPWVSVGFAIFLYCLLKSGIIKIVDFDPNGPSAPYFFLVLAFIAGFSERFISDFITRTEDRVLGPQIPRKDDKATGSKPTTAS